MADVQSTAAASRRSTKTSSTTSSTNMSNNDTVAAMRHLRSIVQSIAMDENISPTQRTQKIQNFEQLLDKAEKQLHYKKGAGGAGVCELLDDPLNIKTSKQVVNAAEVLKNKNKSNNNKKKNKEWKKKGWLKAGRLLGRQRAANKSISSSSGVGESGARLSTTYEGLEVDTRHETEVQRRDMALQNNNEEETRDETDSIIDIRDQNSYDYTASIESLRSLNTFEKDFINNVTAEHARMEAAAAEDGNSVGTFEQDFVGPVRNNNNVYPTQVEQHQMYNDDAISETTFEADARSLEPLENQGVVGNGGQGGGSVFVPQMPRMVQTTEHEEVEDDITVDTLENDERADNNVPRQQHQQPPNPVLNAWGSAPTTLTTFNNMVKTAFSADNSSSILSVSTFEKDTIAIQALAAKIGRTPSIKAKKSAAIPEELESVASDGTFEQDQKMRMRSQISLRINTHQDGMVLNNASEVSTSTFEKDMNVHQPKPHLSVIGEAASSKLGHSASRQQSTAGGVAQTNNVVSPPQMMMHQPPHADTQVRPNDNSTQGWFGGSARENQDAGVISVHTPVTSKSNVSGPSPYTQIMNNQARMSSAAAKQEAAATEAKAKLTKISPLAVELSPSTVDKGVKKKKAQSSGSLWDRFVCGI